MQYLRFLLLVPDFGAVDFFYFLTVYLDFLCGFSSVFRRLLSNIDVS